mgnify:CR=1 FL=1
MRVHAVLSESTCVGGCGYRRVILRVCMRQRSQCENAFGGATIWGCCGQNVWQCLADNARELRCPHKLEKVAAHLLCRGQVYLVVASMRPASFQLVSHQELVSVCMKICEFASGVFLCLNGSMTWLLVCLQLESCKTAFYILNGGRDTISVVHCVHGESISC